MRSSLDGITAFLLISSLIVLGAVRSVALAQTPDELEAAESIRALGGTVYFNEHMDCAGFAHFDESWNGGNDGLANLGRIENLRSVGFSDSAITNSGLRHIGELTSLTWLRLEHVPVSDAGLEHLARLKSLEELFLVEIQITDAGLRYLSDLPKLRVLDLSRTDITDAGLMHLRGLTGLRRLDFGKTTVTDAGVSALGLPHLATIRRYDEEARRVAPRAWFTQEDWNWRIEGNPPIEELPTETACDLLETLYPNPAHEWSRYASDPKTVQTNAERRRIIHARIKSLSPEYVIIEVLRPPASIEPTSKIRGQAMYECAARYKLRRTPRLDLLFDAQSFEQKFGYTYKGIGYGSTCSWPRRVAELHDDDVTHALGLTEFIEHKQLMGMFSLYYPADNLHVFCWAGRVYYVEHKKPYFVTELERTKATANLAPPHTP